MLIHRSALASLLAPLVFVTALAGQQRDPQQYRQVLESPERVAGLQIEKVVATLALEAGTRVADLGAGTGIFTIPMAQAVGSRGVVYAIDIDPGLLAIVTGKAQEASLGHVRTIVAGPTEPRLPEPVDLLFICDTLHHLPDQADYVKQFASLLRPGGRVAVIDFAEGHWPAGHEAFTITPDQVDGWMQAAGFRRTARHTFLETNFFHVYELASR